MPGEQQAGEIIEPLSPADDVHSGPSLREAHLERSLRGERCDESCAVVTSSRAGVAEVLAYVALGVQVDEQYPVAGFSCQASESRRKAGFADSAFPFAMATTRPSGALSMFMIIIMAA